MADVVEGEFILAGGAGDAAGRIEVRNPADIAEVIGTYPVLGAHHVDRAVEAAKAVQPAWAGLPATQRGERLIAAIPDIEAIEGLDELLVREQGKVLWEATFEVGFYEMAARAVVDYAESLDADQALVEDGMGRITVHAEPYGVVGAITPWNYPFAISATKVVPALLAGNAVVLVISPSTPFTALAGFRALASHLPEGLLSVITGPGPKIGQRLVEHPDVPKLTFTGSTATGKIISRAASDNLKDVTLELGGNDAAVIVEDCEIDDRLIGELVTGAFTTTGQVCLAIKRIYAPAAKVADLADGIASALDDFVIGPGLDPETTMGPLHNKVQRDHVIDLVAAARDEGAMVRECGTLNGDPDKGWFLLPSVVTGAAQRSRIVQEEQFGPTLPVVGYDTLDEAIALANDTEYGLCSSIWTADEDRGRQLARRMQAGSTYINSHGLFSVDPRAPFGGFKHSGVGRELGWAGLLAFTQPHTVSTRHM